ncbi:FAD binding domain-containing protein [Chloroflexota bacterium]
MKDFEYLRAKDVDEAISLLERYGSEASIIGGGTDLLNNIRMRTQQPDYVIDIKSIPGLNNLTYDTGNGLTIGALTTIQTIIDSSLLREKYPILSETASQMASWQVRNRATVGGNLCNAAPSADMAPPLIALGANVTIIGSSGTRSLPLENFFKGPGLTDLRRDEILTQINVPVLSANTVGVYLKGRVKMSMDLALVGVAVVVTYSKDGICEDIKIAYGAVGPTPIRSKEAEQVCKGNTITEDIIEKAVIKAQIEAKPITDCRCPAEYRLELIMALTGRALKEAWRRSRNGGLSDVC